MTDEAPSNRLNIGCGHDTRVGWINLDRVHLDGVDLVHDLTQCPWPFEGESFVEILAKDVLEHVHNLTEVITESHRVLKPGGTLTIQVPHFTSKDAFSDPTHVRPFSSLSFDYFTATHSRSYYAESNFSSVVERTILFDRRLGYPWNYLLQRLVNRSQSARNYYEGSPLRAFPATNVIVRLQK